VASARSSPSNSRSRSRRTTISAAWAAASPSTDVATSAQVQSRAFAQFVSTSKLPAVPSFSQLPASARLIPDAEVPSGAVVSSSPRAMSRCRPQYVAAPKALSIVVVPAPSVVAATTSTWLGSSKSGWSARAVPMPRRLRIRSSRVATTSSSQGDSVTA